MSLEVLQALGWVWCMVGFAWHVRRTPAIVRRPVLGPQPLTVTLERVGGDKVRAIGHLELSRVDPEETRRVADELARLRDRVIHDYWDRRGPGPNPCLDEDCPCQDAWS